MDQDDEYYHNAKNRHEMYSLKEGDHVIGEFILISFIKLICSLIMIQLLRCIEKIWHCICMFIYGHFGHVFPHKRFSKVSFLLILNVTLKKIKRSKIVSAMCKNCIYLTLVLV